MTVCFATPTTHPVIQKNIRTTKVFAKMMMEDNVRTAVHWITKRSGGGVLHPSDTATLSGTDPSNKTVSVLDVLCQKHPEP